MAKHSARCFNYHFGRAYKHNATLITFPRQFYSSQWQFLTFLHFNFGWFFLTCRSAHVNCFYSLFNYHFGRVVVYCILRMRHEPPFS